MIHPFGTLTSRDTPAMLMADCHEAIAGPPSKDCYFRMMAAHEFGRGCNVDADFADCKGTFQMWRSASEVDGCGCAVSPQVE